MRSYVAKKARRFRSWLNTETKSEIRGWQQLEWLLRELSEPVAVTNMAVHPSTLAWVINDLRINRRQHIVELGAGLSTQLIAKCLQKSYPSGIVPVFVSVEEDKDWIAYLRQLLNKDGLGEYVTFVHAPRTPIAQGSWYRQDTLDEALSNKGVDLLLIDGPSIRQPAQREDRLAAVDYFLPRMADTYTLFVDDAERPAERKLLKMWSERTQVEFETMNAYLGVITKGQHFVSRPF